MKLDSREDGEGKPVSSIADTDKKFGNGHSTRLVNVNILSSKLENGH